MIWLEAKLKQCIQGWLWWSTATAWGVLLRNSRLTLAVSFCCSKASTRFSWNTCLMIRFGLSETRGLQDTQGKSFSRSSSCGTVRQCGTSGLDTNWSSWSEASCSSPFGPSMGFSGSVCHSVSPLLVEVNIDWIAEDVCQKRTSPRVFIFFSFSVIPIRVGLFARSVSQFPTPFFPLTCVINQRMWLTDRHSQSGMMMMICYPAVTCMRMQQSGSPPLYRSIHEGSSYRIVSGTRAHQETDFGSGDMTFLSEHPSLWECFRATQSSAEKPKISM